MNFKQPPPIQKQKNKPQTTPTQEIWWDRRMSVSQFRSLYPLWSPWGFCGVFLISQRCSCTWWTFKQEQLSMFSVLLSIVHWRKLQDTDNQIPFGFHHCLLLLFSTFVNAHFLAFADLTDNRELCTAGRYSHFPKQMILYDYMYLSLLSKGMQKYFLIFSSK